MKSKYHTLEEYRSILENGANEVHAGRGILSKNRAIQNIGAYNERIANETRRISDTGILYQSVYFQETEPEQQNEPLLAGFTTQEIFDRLQALNEEYGNFTSNTPQKVLDNQMAKNSCSRRCA